jgi:hypothetical protein
MAYVMTKEEATEALVQLTGDFNNPIGCLRLMIGAFAICPKDNHISFAFHGCRKANYFKIEYDPTLDLYNAVFCKFGKSELKEVQRWDGVYGDQLNELFTNFTGLSLTVPHLIFTSR